VKPSIPLEENKPASLPRPRGGDALILAGGVAKGAFIAGAVLGLAQTVPLRVRRIVATSSGALSGVLLAAAIRDGRGLAIAGAELAALWREKASVAGAFDLSPAGIASRTGLSTSAKLMALLRQYVRPARQRRPIELRLVMTNAAGDAAGGEGEEETTTFEHVACFRGSAFDDEKGLEEVFRAASASAAFPVAFQPVDMDVSGRRVPCFDGGLVDNAPVKLAVDDPYVTRVFVVAPYPARYEGPPRLHGGALLVHLAEILVQERLCRDLREAHATNHALAELAALVPDPRARRAVLEAIGWKGRRPIEIVEIRPPRALPGGAFDGFCRPALREEYIDAGHEAARAWAEEERALARKVG
jgi:predicted acylesterase/phospholipase RssA